MTSLILDVDGRLYPKDQEYSFLYCQQIPLNQLYKRHKYRGMRGRHTSVYVV